MSVDINCLDHQLCEKMAEHIEKLTLSGQSSFDVEILKKFKKICRISDLYVKHAFNLLMSTLEKDHAEIRLSTFKLIDELFNRSHCFRELLVSEFQTFLELTVEISHDQPLPPPTSVAKKLRAETLKAIQQWFEKYGEAYKKLVLGYNFLKSCKMVDFNDIRSRTITERLREEEIERKKRIVLNQKLDKVLQEIRENVPEIDTCTTEIENCLNLLVPRPEDFFINDSSEFDSVESSSDINKSAVLYETNSVNINKDDKELNSGDEENELNSGDEENELNSGDEENELNSGDEENELNSGDEDNDFMDSCQNSSFVNDFGLGTRKYNLSIEIRPKSFGIEETDDNKDIFKTLRDSIRIVKAKYLPKFTKWLEILTKAGENNDTVKEMIDLKNKLNALLTKCVEMKISEDSQIVFESDDDEFEDVPEKEGYEAEVPLYLLTAAEMGLKENYKKSRGRKKRTNKNWCVKADDVSFRDPTTRAANLIKMGLMDRNNDDKAGTSFCKLTQSSDIPTVSFGPDIAHWENPDQIEKPMVIKYDSLHRFWTPPEHESEKPSQHDVAAITSRTFHYPGKFVPVTWGCRAPLANGFICQRMDRVKCPFHGRIIGRDTTGRPSNIVDARILEAENAKRDEERIPEWRDPELQIDIETALNIDLGSSSSKSKGKGKGKSTNKKYANLTDIKEIKNTSRNRLQAKIFNRKAMKRVTSVLDAADYKRVRDKFGNQFNYAHSK